MIYVKAYVLKAQKKSAADIKPEDLEFCKQILVRIYKNISRDG